MQKSQRALGELFSNNTHPHFCTIWVSDEPSHEYGIPLTTLIRVAKSGQTKSIQSFPQHIIKTTIKRTPNSRMRPTCSSETDYTPQASRPYWLNKIPPNFIKVYFRNTGAVSLDSSTEIFTGSKVLVVSVSLVPYHYILKYNRRYQ